MAISAEDYSPGVHRQRHGSSGHRLPSHDREAAANVDAAIAYAKASGTRVIFDIDYRPLFWRLVAKDAGESRYVSSDLATAATQHVLPYADLIVGTEEEIRIAGGDIDTRKALVSIRRLSAAPIVMKRGPQGCVVFDGRDTRRSGQGDRWAGISRGGIQSRRSGRWFPVRLSFGLAARRELERMLPSRQCLRCAGRVAARLLAGLADREGACLVSGKRHRLKPRCTITVRLKRSSRDDAPGQAAAGSRDRLRGACSRPAIRRWTTIASRVLRRSPLTSCFASKCKPRLRQASWSMAPAAATRFLPSARRQIGSCARSKYARPQAVIVFGRKAGGRPAAQLAAKSDRQMRRSHGRRCFIRASERTSTGASIRGGDVGARADAGAGTGCADRTNSIWPTASGRSRPSGCVRTGGELRHGRSFGLGRLASRHRGIQSDVPRRSDARRRRPRSRERVSRCLKALSSPAGNRRGQSIYAEPLLDWEAGRSDDATLAREIRQISTG